MPTDPATPDNSAQIAYWNDRAGATWVAFQERLDAAFAPLTAAALQRAAPQAGEAAVDIGCGCGATVLELAQRVGPSGRVLGLDVSQPMASRARDRIAAAAIPNASVVVGDAAAHPFAADADLMFSRFGVMFFADPVAAFSNLRRGLKPGGRLLFAAWRPLADNSWFSVPLATALPLLPPQPPAEPNAPGPFAFADLGRVSAILTEAGWAAVQAEPVEAPIRIAEPGQIADAASFAMGVGALARLLAEADDTTRSRVRAVLEDTLAAYDGPGGVCLGGSVWLVSAAA